MPAIDLTTALARLLHDSRLRDQFAADPASVAAGMELRDSDRAVLQALNAEDVEFQAQVLLRKRLDTARPMIPRTCEQLGDQVWPLFSRFARGCWPKENPPAAADAYAFCSYLQSAQPGAVSRLEWNRLSFARSRKLLAAHLLRRSATRNNTALQILFRLRPCGWREVLLYVKL